MKEIDIATAWLKAMNNHNLEEMSSLYSQDIIGEEIADPPARDFAGLVEGYRELFVSFPDCKAKILNIFSDGHQVLAEIRWTGTNTNKFRGQLPTNKFTDLRIAYIFSITNGKIDKLTEYYDAASI